MPMRPWKGSTRRSSKRARRRAPQPPPSDGGRQLQVPLWLGERLEPEACVQAVGVTCGEQPATKALELGMLQQCGHHRLGQATALVLRKHVHIAQPGERRPVGDGADQAHLGLLATAAIRSIGAIRQEVRPDGDGVLE